MNQNKNTEEMSKTRLCWHLNAVFNIVCSFYSEFMLGRGEKISSSEKDPGENTGKFLLF